MWTVVVSLLLCSLGCAVATSPPVPTDVRFSSVNLRNVLKWLPGNGPSDDTHFTVEYAIYGESVAGSKGRRVHWKAVQMCAEVARTWCDLSRETEDEEQGYYARVRAVRGREASKWALTPRRFDPKSDTTFGPPLVSVEIDNNSAIITLKGPMRYLSKKGSSVLSLAAIYPQMTYNLSINNINRKLMHHIPVVASPYKYRLLDYNTEYCFSAQSRFLSMPIQCQSSAWHCVTTPQDPVIEQLRRVVVCIVVPGLCLGVIAVAGYVLYQYLTGKGQKFPYTLNPPSSHPPPVIFPPEYPSHILVSVIHKEAPSDPVSIVSFPKPQRAIADHTSSYSPQSPNPEPEELSDASSADYGFVGPAPVINVGGEGGDGERRRGGETDGTGEHQTCGDGDSYQRKEFGALGVPPTGVSAQETCYRLQNSLHTSLLPQTPAHPQTETNPVLQACAGSHGNPVLLARNQQPAGEVNRKEVEERPGLFLERNPQTGLFKVFENIASDSKVRKRPAMNERLRVEAEELDGGADEGSNQENIPLFSAYASQDAQNTPPCPDYLPNEYAFLTTGDNQEPEEDGHYYYEGEAGPVCVDWDPESRKLMLPEVRMRCTEAERLEGWRESEEEGSEGRTGAEGEESYVTKGGLRLENVFVRQASEEEAEARRALERGGEEEWEVEDLLKKWKLSISMSE